MLGAFRYQTKTKQEASAMAAGDMEVDASDAIRLILQFLKENRLFHAMRALQEESQVSLNAVDSMDAFASDIAHGRWDAVLQQTQTLECDSAAMTDLYEHVVLEMLEMKEKDVALRLLRASEPMRHLRSSNVERYVATA
jgi:WD40 repeat-containing protein SMU1